MYDKEPSKMPLRFCEDCLGSMFLLNFMKVFMIFKFKNLGKKNRAGVVFGKTKHLGSDFLFDVVFLMLDQIELGQAKSPWTRHLAQRFLTARSC